MLRFDRPPGAAALLIAGLLPAGLALGPIVPARAADWYTGAPAKTAAEDWIVSLDASTTVTSNNSVFANIGGTAAVNGTLGDSGVRAKVEALVGRFEYRANAGATVQGEQVEGAALLGYEWIWREAKLAGYVGLAVRNTSLSITDPSNPAGGTTYGLKSAIDFYARPTDTTMVSAYGSFTTNDKAYFARLKAGYRLGEGIYIGPEAAVLGNDFYNQWRVGAHLSGLQLGPVQASLSAGYQFDRAHGAGAYGAVDLRAQF